MAEQEEKRLVTIRHRTLPVDVIHPDHEDVHSDLEAWGLWSRSRSQGIRCGSAEGNYRSGYRSWHYPTAGEMMPHLPNPRARQVDRAVLGLPDQHRTTVRLYYVRQSRPEAICRAVVIRYEDFGRWMRDCRCMVLNQLRRLEA